MKSPPACCPVRSPFGFALGRIIVGGGTTIDVALNALEQKGIARSLAEPNLVALSGDTASFLAGGEYPIPVSGSLGQVTVDYKKYGVGLAFTPTVLGRGLINMKIQPEVSQIDTTHTVSVGGGISVPALIVRRASTTVELRDGQSFVLGGLLQNDNKHQHRPVALARQRAGAGRAVLEQVLSRRTKPIWSSSSRRIWCGRRGRAMSSSTPLDDTLPPNDCDFFLLGKTEITRAQAKALTPESAQFAEAEREPFTGHMLEIVEGDFQCGASNNIAARHRARRPAGGACRLLGISRPPRHHRAQRRRCRRHRQGRRQMVDPWPRDSANRDIAFNGEKMQAAVKRYRTDRVYPPSGHRHVAASYQQGAAPRAIPRRSDRP